MPHLCQPVTRFSDQRIGGIIAKLNSSNINYIISSIAIIAHERLERYSSKAGAPPRKLRCFAAARIVARLAENGEGIAHLPLYRRGRAGNGLKQILVGWEAPQLWLTLYPPYERLPLRVAKFSDFFESHVTETRPL